MCNVAGIVFGVTSFTPDEIKGKTVLEVGSLDVNGSLQPIFKSWKPKKYVGADIEMGPGVDVVVSGEDLMTKFKPESFDVVISTETMEHVRDWRKVISNLKAVCKPEGTIVVTTRSLGFFFHAYPYDFWRYEVADMKKIFEDCTICKLESDPQNPGVFIKVKKPKNFKEKDLSNLKLHSMVANKRIKDVSDKDFKTVYYRRLIAKEKLKDFILSSGKNVFGKM
jgi:SAM-dependent methyltransferase